MQTPALNLSGSTLQNLHRELRANRHREDPVAYAKEVLGVTVTPEQAAIMRSVVVNRRTAVKASHAIGKCVAASEWLTMANGRKRQAKDLVGKSFSLLTLHEGKAIPAKAKAEWNAVEPVLAVVTESGRRIVRNGQHPLWAANLKKGPGIPSTVTPLGWTAIEDLEPGQLVAVPEAFPCFGRPVPGDEVEIRLLAYLIGDGGFTKSGVVFTQQENAVLDEFTVCAESYGCRLNRRSAIDWGVAGASGGNRKGSNPIINLLRKHDLMGKHSRDKRIPAMVFTLPKRQLRIFLSRLYATDGWASVDCRGVAEIGFCSASEGLIRDLQELLLRFGVNARIAAKPKVNAWTLYIRDYRDQLAFCDKIGIFGKEDAVERVRTRAKAKVGSQQCKQWRKQKAEPRTRWEKIASIEPAGVEATVAIEVPGHHTYLTTFWEHNTFLAGVLANWWYDCWDEHICYITAPTWGQALDRTFKTMRFQRQERNLPGQILETGILREPHYKKRLKHFVKALNAETGEGFQGDHDAPILLILEEAVGVPRHIWEAGGVGLMTDQRCRMLAIANPTNESTQFGDACSSELWEVFTVSVFSHPNIAAGLKCETLPVPSAVNLHWLWEQLLENCIVVDTPAAETFEFYGIDVLRDATTRGIPVPDDAPKFHYLPNADFQGRVLGQFPSLPDQQVIPLAWLESLPKLEVEDENDWQLGCDPARFGSDRTVIAIRQGPCLRFLREVRQFDTMAVAGACIEALHTVGCPHPLKVPLCIDVTGGLGAGPADRLREQGYNVQDINSSGKPGDQTKYVNVRSELWFSMRDRVRAREVDISGVRADQQKALKRELSRPTYTVNSTGKRVVEDKTKLKERLTYSPDLADGFNLAYYTRRLPELRVFTI